MHKLRYDTWSCVESKMITITYMQQLLTINTQQMQAILRRLIIIILCVFITGLTNRGWGQQSRLVTIPVHLQHGSILPHENALHWLDSMHQSGIKGPQQVLIQYHALPDAQQKQQLQKAGIHMHDYIPEYTFLSILHLPLQDSLPSGLLKSIIPVVPDWKYAPALVTRMDNQTTQLTLLVHFFKEVSHAAVEEIIARAGGKILDKKYQLYHAYKVQIPASKCLQLAENPWVKSMDVYTETVPLNKDSRSSSGAAILQQTSSQGGYGLDGKGITIGVGDNSQALTHVDARDRVINFNQAHISMHGVHTTLTAAGMGIMDPATRGMAPQATIINHYYELVWLQAKAMFQGYNMVVTNNSYASVINDCNVAGKYNSLSVMLDECGLENPEVLQVFAAGNDGLNTCNGYPEGYNTITGGFQPAKNILVVGALDKNNIPWPKTSRGPVADGRIKPEVVAYGYDVYSGDIHDGYGKSNGTSMAAPIVTGCVALLGQAYNQMFGTYPPTSLIKALVINGATDYGNPGPDFIYGYGLINTERSLEMLYQGHYHLDTVQPGSVQTHSITVPAGVSEAKFLLYWHDVPASELAAQQLVNNLDLELLAPDGTVYYPFVLDDSPSGVAADAVTGVDSKNNVEQIVVANPAAGNYTLRVKGTHLPSGNWPYAISYDFVPIDMSFRFPFDSVAIASGDSTRIYWNAPVGTGDFLLEWSPDNGASWQTLAANIPATQRHFNWFIPDGITTAEARVRLTRIGTGMQITSGVFVINPIPELQLATNQCPGYLAITWNNIPQATGYEILKKGRYDFISVDTIIGTEYVFSGLHIDSTYYVSVRPLIQGKSGYRSKALRHIPNTGSCVGNISDYDLAVQAILSPVSGRVATSGALSQMQTIKVVIANLDDQPTVEYRVSCSVNQSPWQSQTHVFSIPPLSTDTMSFSFWDMEAEGEYEIIVAVENLAHTDPVWQNDTMRIKVRQLSNNPVDLFAGYKEDFESYPAFTYEMSMIGLLPGNAADNRWDFSGEDEMRLRSFVHQDIVIEGNRSLSLDRIQNGEATQNYLMGTFHLSAYDTSNTEARLEFAYKFHGTPKTSAGNEVWIRGSDTDPWILLYVLDTTVNEGEIQRTSSISLTHALVSAGQNFSSSFQIRFGQKDTSCIAHNQYGNGLTLDDIRLYSVKNDVQLLAILSPSSKNCGAVPSGNVVVQVYNSDNLPQENIQLYYRLNNGSIYTGTIPYLAPKDTVLFTFAQPFPTLNEGIHYLDAWLVADGDTYNGNDSMMGYEIQNSIRVAEFPYFQNFETHTEGWYASGNLVSWKHGKPEGTYISQAASGEYAWYTGKNGGQYFNREHSFLYSPCFDLSQLERPVLSFSLNTALESCGNEPCDFMYLAYSLNGGDWISIPSDSFFLNGYNNIAIQAWDDDHNHRWRPVSVYLPRAEQLQLRFVLKTDMGVMNDGVGIDDIHIYDYQFPIYQGANTTLGISDATGKWIVFEKDASFLATVLREEQDKTNTYTLNYYRHESTFNEIVRQYILPLSYTIHGGVSPTSVRFYLTDEDMLRMLDDHSCDTCARVADAYRLGMLQYGDPNMARENASFLDNEQGSYQYIPYTKIHWVPYGKGYFAETEVSDGEVWFTTRIPGKKIHDFTLFPNPVRDYRFYLSWSAFPGEGLQVQVKDILGKTVFSQQYTASAYDNVQEVHLPVLSPGIYIVQYQAGQQRKVVKVVIH